MDSDCAETGHSVDVHVQAMVEGGRKLLGDARLITLVFVLLVASLANAGVLVHANSASSPAINFTVEINNDSQWLIDGAYYSNPTSTQLVLVIGGGALWLENDRIARCSIGYPATGIPDDALVRFHDSGFNVADIRSGTFFSLSTLEINTILIYLATRYNAPTTVSLIGFSAGGVVTAAYLLGVDRWNVHRAAILDAPLEMFNSASLTVPTLLIYGLNDTTTPASQSAYAWLTNAPTDMTNMNAYPYEHNPWSPDIASTTTTAIETRILAHLNGGVPAHLDVGVPAPLDVGVPAPLNGRIRAPEYSFPLILLAAFALTLCCILVKRKGNGNKTN